MLLSKVLTPHCFLCVLGAFMFKSVILLNLQIHLKQPNFNLSAIFEQSSELTNIIFILADDLGYNDIGYNADDNLSTPILDNLALYGLKLTNYYTLCVCSASRGVLLTGRYDIHNGLRGISTQTSKKGIALNELLISDILHQYANYSTYFIGKWHVGRSIWKQTPTWRGFEYFYGMLGGANDYFTHFCRRLHSMDWSEHIGINCTENKNCSRICEEDYGIYSTHLMSNKAIEVINNHTNNPKQKNKPFFIYLSYQAIHSPPQVPLEYKLKYLNKTKNSKRIVASAMIDCMDEGVGNITKILKQKNLFDNTIIIFTSDNGAPIATSDGVGGENFPLRGGKHSIYEGGTKVPAIIHYPNMHKSVNVINNEYKHIFHAADWVPTLIEAAGIDINKVINYKKNNTYLKNSLDGKSHWKNLYQTESKQTKIRDFLYYGNDVPVGSSSPGNKFAIRWNEYKLFYNGGGGKPDLWYKHNATINLLDTTKDPKVLKFNLVSKSNYFSKSSLVMYDIINDPFETLNIYDNNSSYKQDIKSILNQWKKQLDNNVISNIQQSSCSHAQFVTLLNVTHNGYKTGIIPGCIGD